MDFNWHIFFPFAQQIQYGAPPCLSLVQPTVQGIREVTTAARHAHRNPETLRRSKSAALERTGLAVPTHPKA